MMRASTPDLSAVCKIALRIISGVPRGLSSQTDLLISQRFLNESQRDGGGKFEAGPEYVVKGEGS